MNHATYRCHGCTATFKGRIKDDGNHVCGGLLNHLKQGPNKGKGRHKNNGKRNLGSLTCLGVYQSRSLVSPEGEIDISTSIEDESLSESIVPIQKRPRLLDSDSDVSVGFGEEETRADSAAMEPPEDKSLAEVFFANMFLKPSNSMGKTSQFSNHLPQKVFSSNSMLSNKEMNMQSFPSTKLLPPISLETLLSYDTSKLGELEQQAKHIIKSLDAGLLISTTMDAGYDSSDLESLQSDDVPPDSEEENEGDSEAEDAEADEGMEEELAEAGGVEEEEENMEELLPPYNLQDVRTYLTQRAAKEEGNREHLNGSIPDDVYVHLLMMQLQEKHGLSLSAVDDIYEWAFRSSKIQPNIFAMGKKPVRKQMLTDYRKLLGMEDAFCFKEDIIHWLPDMRPTSQYVRPFLDCVYELLTNKILLGHNSCNISLPHKTDPFKHKPSEKIKSVSELHHGRWWGKTMKKKRNGHGPNSPRILCPIILETDETHTDVNSRLPATPVNIKLGIFNTETRKRNEASTTWFYLLDDDAEAAHHQQKTLPIHKMQNLHTALRNGFHELKFLMDNDVGLEWELFYGGKLHKVELVFSIAYTISDTAMHNKLCCKYGVNNDKIKSICRHCKIESDKLIDPEAFKLAQPWGPDDSDLTKHRPDDSEYWKSISHHPVANAVDELCHGSNRLGVHFASPGEFLHMHQKGALKRSVESFEYQFKGGTQILLDEQTLAEKQVGITKGIDSINHAGHQVGVILSRQSDRNRPRTKFKNALLSTTKKTGDEHGGIVLCLVILLMTDRGRQICLQERTMNEDFLDNFVYVFEMVLIMEQWLKQPSFQAEELQDHGRLFEAFAVYIENVGQICQREGMGSNLPKNHLMLHVPQYVHQWGPPSGWDGSNMERGHKKGVKQPSKLTQRRQDVFIPQLATRYSESRLIQRMLEVTNLSKSLWNQENQENRNQMPGVDQHKSKCGGSWFTLGLDGSKETPGVKWKNNQGRQCHIQGVVDLVYDHIVTNMSTNSSSRAIRGFTEFKADVNGVRQIFRAHPSYRSRSRQQRDVWYDWALFDLEAQGFGEYFLPGQILMFIEVPYLQDQVDLHGVKIKQNQPHAVVRLFQEKPTADFRAAKINTETTQETDYSLLVEFGRTNDFLHIVPCSCISEPVIVIPNLLMIQPKVPPKGSKKKRKAKTWKRKLPH